MRVVHILPVLFFAVTLRLPALLFEPIPTTHGDVLLIRDCKDTSDAYSKKFSNDLATYMQKRDSSGCKPWETMFSGKNTKYDGDGEILKRALRAQLQRGKPFSEVWLFSGGGSVQAAIEMARTFRANQLTLRIKDGFYCVSACTIAFMGGYFRYMDEGGTYQVHSASSVLEALNGDQINSSIKGVLDNPEQGLLSFAGDCQMSMRFMAMRVFRLFQNTLIIPLNKSVREDDDAFWRWAESDLPHWKYLDSNSQERARDVVRIQAERAAAVQDVLMRQKDSGDQSHGKWRCCRARLGQRASMGRAINFRRNIVCRVPHLSSWRGDRAIEHR